jgi:hypothetical protein
MPRPASTGASTARPPPLDLELRPPAPPNSNPPPPAPPRALAPGARLPPSLAPPRRRDRHRVRREGHPDRRPRGPQSRRVRRAATGAHQRRAAGGAPAAPPRVASVRARGRRARAPVPPPPRPCRLACHCISRTRRMAPGACQLQAWLDTQLLLAGGGASICVRARPSQLQPSRTRRSERWATCASILTSLKNKTFKSRYES